MDNEIASSLTLLAMTFLALHVDARQRCRDRPSLLVPLTYFEKIPGARRTSASSSLETVGSALDAVGMFHFVLAGCIIHATRRARLSLGGTVAP
jgi:hypothetical protein